MLEASRLVGVLACAFLLACGQEPEPRVLRPGPLPFEPARPEIPDDSELVAQLADAVEFRLGSNYDHNIDAVDPGEGVEHATLTQVSIDRGIHGLDALFAVGDELFEYEFRVENGLGNGLRRRPGIRAGGKEAPNMRRVHKSEFGGPDSHSCATCHSKGGPDGAGTNTQNAYLRGNGRNANTADERNAPHVLGLGAVQALAIEMSKELQAQRDAALEAAALSAEAQEIPLESKGVSFGVLKISAEGEIDTAAVTGIDPDLVVKPFGWKGHQATIRGMAEESFRIHIGILSMREQAAVRDGNIPPINHGDGTWYDLDRDGTTLEVDSGMLTTMVSYLSQLEVPVVRPPKDEYLLDLFGRGELLFEEIGCAQCHRSTLILHDPVLKVRPVELRYADRPPIEINVATDGEHPKIEPLDRIGTYYKVHLFSDLRRHDMGPELTSGFEQGHLSRSVFLTRSLWGLADTAPYLHDGRAPTVHDAIVWHGGDARAQRDLYLGLDKEERDAILVFLLSLGREPKLFVP